MIRIRQNKFFSYNSGQLPKGCKYCVKGEKLVIFITGICPRRCYFCPVSDEKYQKDVVFANERKVKTADDLIMEARVMDAKGAGITGGDPLTRPERTTECIRMLKRTFGKDFHIHLYTSLNLVDEKKLSMLSNVGLDEIRFHLELDDDRLWGKLQLAGNFRWDVGVEIPLIPGKSKETKKVIDFISDKVGFLNLNELEVADNQQSKLLESGFRTKDKDSYAVAGSLELGISLLNYVKEKEYSLPVHLCTAKLKDAVQLGNRLKREAKGMKKSFDIVDKEGMLTRGALYLHRLKPGFGYHKKLASIDKSNCLYELELLMRKMEQRLGIELFLDRDKLRILLSKSNVKKHRLSFINLGLVPAIVKEYPTADQLEIEVEFLSK